VADVNARLKGLARKALGRDAVFALEQRVASLEGDIEELRQQNLRLAEIADVVQELLVPLASRDQDRIDAALEGFPKSL
jgi:hypothetical protein